MIFPEQIRELSWTDQGIFIKKLEDFPEQNKNCKSADYKIFLNGSGNFPEQIRKISATSGTLPEHSTVTIWPELFQVEHLKCQAFYLNSCKCVQEEAQTKETSVSIVLENSGFYCCGKHLFLLFSKTSVSESIC